jgi:hypothetical protein
VRQRAQLFDVLHFHIDYWPNSVFLRQKVPFLTTLHGCLDLPEFAAVYRMFPNVPLVSISDSQRRPLPDVGWAATIYHGMPEHLLTPMDVPNRDYFAFLVSMADEISPEVADENSPLRCGLVASVSALRLLAIDHGLHAVVEDLGRRPAERLERGCVAAQQRLHVLVRHEPASQHAAVAEHEREQPHHTLDARLVGEHRAEMREIDLRLTTGRRLEADLEPR